MAGTKYDDCKCGNRKTAASKMCRKCWYDSTTTKSHRDGHPCVECGAERKTRTIADRCRKCYTKKRKEGQAVLDDSQTIGDLVYKDGQNKYSAIRMRLRRRIDCEQQGRPLVCEECGFEHGVQVCHIKPISEFPLDTKISEVNNRNNIKLLCPNHHWLFDHPPS
jgi:predicted restriction endonuclease